MSGEGVKMLGLGETEEPGPRAVRVMTEPWGSV